MGRPSITRRTWGRWSRSRRDGEHALAGDLSASRAEFAGNGKWRRAPLNPAVVHDGRVFVAPSDADAIFAFDATTGAPAWKSNAISDDVKLSHLLGVAKDRLVATGDRVLLFDVKTGKLRHAWPDSGQSVKGYGRGLLAGDFIYWPTKNEIEILDQRTALRAVPRSSWVKPITCRGGIWSPGMVT